MGTGSLCLVLSVSLGTKIVNRIYVAMCVLCCSCSAAFAQSTQLERRGIEIMGPSFKLSDYIEPESDMEKQSKAQLSACRRDAARQAPTDTGVKVLLEECQKDYESRRSNTK